jgi:hypothetical protein
LITGADPHNFISGQHNAMNICSASLRSIISVSVSLSQVQSRPWWSDCDKCLDFIHRRRISWVANQYPGLATKKKNSLFWDWDLTWVRTIDWVCHRICNTSCFLGSKKLECEINDKTLGFLCLPTRTWSWQTGVHPVLFLLTRLASVFRGRLPRLCVKPANEERLEVEEEQFWGWERRRDGSPRVYRIVGRRM